MSKLLIDYSEITNEYRRREGIREAIYRKKARNNLLVITNDIVNRIRAIDRTIPIMIYDPAKHGMWKAKRGDGVFSLEIPICQYGYLKRRNLISKGNMSEDEHYQKMAELFVDRAWLADRDCYIKNKKEWIYIIGKFEVDLWRTFNDEDTMMGYCIYEKEMRKNIIKGQNKN